MTSLRHNPDPPEAGGALRSARDLAGARDAYLDAARACILDVGWRRTTLTEVARRAGVSRMTIYRAWSDMPALLGDLMTREWGTLVTGRTGPAAEPSPEGLAEAVVATVRALRDNELFTRIVELDPELILPYLFARRGRSQQLITDVLADAIGAGQRTGRIRGGSPIALARSLVLAAHGFVLSGHTMVDDEVTVPELDAELHHLVTRSLAP